MTILIISDVSALKETGQDTHNISINITYTYYKTKEKNDLCNFPNSHANADLGPCNPVTGDRNLQKKYCFNNTVLDGYMFLYLRASYLIKDYTFISLVKKINGNLSNR
jgi:hypothetical protein